MRACARKQLISAHGVNISLTEEKLVPGFGPPEIT